MTDHCPACGVVAMGAAEMLAEFHFAAGSTLCPDHAHYGTQVMDASEVEEYDRHIAVVYDGLEAPALRHRGDPTAWAELMRRDPLGAARREIQSAFDFAADGNLHPDYVEYPLVTDWVERTAADAAIAIEAWLASQWSE